MTELEKRLAKAEQTIERLKKQIRQISPRTQKKDNPVSNVDENNLTILEAELKNMQLGKDTWTDQERVKAMQLQQKIADIKNGLIEASGNSHNQKRDDRD